jgi:integration host factor subunit beta
MTKSELAEHLSQLHKLPKDRARLSLDAIFDCLLQALSRDERIEIRGFASFETRHYRARKGRNPRTGAPVQVKPKRLPYFKVGKELRDRVANGRHTTSEFPALAPMTPSPSLLGIPAEKILND